MLKKSTSVPGPIMPFSVKCYEETQSRKHLTLKLPLVADGLLPEMAMDGSQYSKMEESEKEEIGPQPTACNSCQSGGMSLLNLLLKAVT